MSWPEIVFGWPAIILALCAFGLAFARRRSALGFAGLAVATPFLGYAGTAPGGRWLSPLVFALLGGAAELLRRGHRGWAIACCAPFVCLVVLLVAAVVSQ
jgi:hypothetical protein